MSFKPREDVKGLALDSRKVKPGYLFAALPGSKTSGTGFILDAVRAGATHILAPKGTELPDDIGNAGVTMMTRDNPRRALSLIAAEFYNAQPQTMVAVTGTNGKTSVAHFTQQLWEALGHQSVSLGTVGIHGTGINRDGSLTTPDQITLHETLAELSGLGITHAAMEASSHGLAQYRLDGVRLKAAAFTNLSRDHLDYHATMEDYLTAKTRLVTEVLEKGGIAVLNADIPEYENLKSASEKAGNRVIAYGKNAEDLKLVSMHPESHGQTLKLEVFGKPYAISLPLVGAFQAYNALCALGLVLAEKPGDAAYAEQCVNLLETIKGAKGRLQSVPGHPAGAGIYVDYAHTPDALETVLKALRPHTDGRLICIMGCGGDRDRGKRPQMGKAACDLADEVIVTDDNPRSEDPAVIRAEIMAGCNEKAQDIGGRDAAIRTGIERLKKGDVLVIAGKGHEQGQTIGDKTIPFDDVQQAEKAIEELKQ